jgi:predicted N-acetyltransferase YhbS
MARRAFAAFLPLRPDETMNASDVAYLPETPAHDAEIEHINEEAFGPGRFARAAYKIREGGPHERALSFVAMHDGAVVASVRLTRIAAGEGRALLLGPLAVRPAFKNIGIGRRLVAIALEAAGKAGAAAVVLVGDEPYYGPLGFKRIPRGQVSMPRPVDLDRILAVEIEPGALARFKGEVCHADHAKLPEPSLSPA